MAKISPIASTTATIELPISEIEQPLTHLIGKPITSIERIYGGRNNRLYRLTCSDAEIYVAKFYPLAKSPEARLTERDRLNSEFSGLEFLWNHGLDIVPKPVTVDLALGCAIYQHVDGQDIPAAGITEKDIDQAVRCLVRIKELCGAEGSAHLPIAAEACFSVQEILQNIDGRLVRLQEAPADGERYQDLHGFLAREFVPAFTEVRQWCQATYDGWGMSLQQELAHSERTLSPSDFGFHNAMKRPNGEIVFLDFEYFGWDDPAKMISDFLLHPAMALGEGLKQRFVDGILSGFHEYEHLARRLAVAYPLFGLKWCTIILNEFLPEKLARREFANGISSDLGEMQAIQLEKARGMLNRVMESYSSFPHTGKSLS